MCVISLCACCALDRAARRRSTAALGGNMRVVAGIALALLFGLLAARLPSFGEAEVSFSWFGFLGGVAVVSLATAFGRIIGPAASAEIRVSPLQRWVLRTSLSLFLLAVASFVLLLYTPWQWPRYALMVLVFAGAMSVFFGVATVWFGQKHGA
jgi:hypothetical protein